MNQSSGAEIRLELFWCINQVHNGPMIYGYARVSTDGQSVDAQVRQLTKAGCKKVFRETASGAKTDRAQLRKALDQLDAGDVLMVTRLDRLARSTRDLLNTLAAITDRKAGFRSLGDTWADTTTAHGRLMLTVLGGLAEFERELIRARTGEGRARAMARGVKMGRQAEDDAAPEEGGATPPRSRRAYARDRAELQRQPQHDFEAQRMTVAPTLDYLLIERALLGSLPIDQLNREEKDFYQKYKPAFDVGRLANRMAQGYYAFLVAQLVAANPQSINSLPPAKALGEDLPARSSAKMEPHTP